MRAARLAILICFSTGSILAAEKPVSFSRQIAPLLVEKCLECHREGKVKGGYRMDTFAQLVKAGDSGETPVTQGSPEQSELLRRVLTEDEDERMPPKGDLLDKAEVALLRQWLAEGGKNDANSADTLLSVMAGDALPRVQPPKAYPRAWPVTAVAAGGGELVATSGYGEVLLWSVNEKKLVARVPGMPERIAGMVWHGDTLAVAGGSPGRSGEVWLVDSKQRKALRRIVTSADVVQAVTISSDGKWLAAGGMDNTIRLFALPEAKLRWELEAHADWVMALAFSPDGSRIVSGSRDRSARVFDVEKGQAVATHEGHAAAVLSLCFVDDGKNILSGDAVGELRRWKLDGALEKNGSTRPGRSALLASQSIGGRVFLSQADQGVVEYDWKEKKVLRTLLPPPSRINAFALTAEPHRLILGAHDGTLAVWDLKENKELTRLAAKP